MALIDLSVFSFSAEQIRDINELIMEDILEAPEISLLHSIYPGIVADKYIGFIGEGGLVGLPDQGCDPIPQTWNISGDQKLWQPKRWEVFLTECYSDLENTMVIYAMNKGVEIGDLTDTDYMAIVVQVLGVAIKKMIWRFTWFGDTNAKNISDGGIITDGVDTEYFKLVDGFWKQLEAAAPSGDYQRVEVLANAAATTTDQFAQLNGQDAYNILHDMWAKAPLSLRKQFTAGTKELPDKYFACTQSFADAYMVYLENGGRGLETSYKNLINGVETLVFRGLPLIPIPIWDEMIAEFENDGTRLNKPHRCILASRSNMAIGVSGTDVLDSVQVWYDLTKDRNYMRAKDSIDVKLLQNKFILAE